MAKETSKSPSADLSAMSFETALAELEDIIQKLETGGVELEKSIELYERGAALRAHCETKLRAAQERIEQIVATGEDAPKAATCRL